MIRNIYGSKYINTTGAGQSLHISPGSQGAGMVRYNTNSEFFEVYDGVSWRQIGESVSVLLRPDAESAIDWALKKMQEEELCRQLAELHPAVADARRKVAQAQEELAVITELVK